MIFRKFLLFLIFFFLFVYFPLLPTARAAESLNVVVNEITWMGTDNSANDEWLELYNNTGTAIKLDGWILKAGDGKPEIKLTGTIVANGFFLLERTDDSTVPNIAADKIYTGVLGNDGEDLKLFDGSGNIIDEVNCSSGWFTGDNATKQTMERKNPQISGNLSTNWQSSQAPGGTPKAKNSQGKKITSQGQEKVKNAESNSLSNTSTPEIKEEKELATVEKQAVKNPSNSIVVFFTALTLAVFFGILILILKKKLKNKNV